MDFSISCNFLPSFYILRIKICGKVNLNSFFRECIFVHYNGILNLSSFIFLLNDYIPFLRCSYIKKL